MEIIKIKEALDPTLYQEPLEYDDNPGPHYQINRGMDDILAASILPFNHYTYLAAVSKEVLGQVSILEAGCGQARTLFDLKKGITFRGEDLYLTDLMVLDEDTQDMLINLVGKDLAGLGTKIHTAGITLSEQHALFAANYEESFRPDRMVVGSLKGYAATTSDRYDFIFDYLGVAVRYPKMAIPSYAKLLKDNGTSLFRLSTFGTTTEEIQRLISLSNLEVLDCRKPKLGNQFVLEVLVGKVA